ncbi:4'-phosphopantetheinyl transferase [Deinococcus indicus]|uniref:Holo-[acyl-carrier-protein] synthase n=1 Tax=Deinococcus indicus TaxID=223556 RepID=A0A246BKM6_9DEIO|nr:4'-phosphopantetheinyl transferase superfamily protein [Deinococcus indicus]OWL95842.1 4'-phosphopantetheinyl transferase [Deinococcus indicus]GHG24533.1 holo-[acyl-carrier-protein] synthase [Deinococcus indicus]
MIIAVGHDLIEIDRIRRMLEREGRRAEKLFTPTELAYCARLSDPAPSLAARFAAKEAFQKVWPRPHGWRDVWVERTATPGGPFPFARPHLEFAPHIAQLMREQGWTAHLTLTHTREHASAVVILEGPAPATDLSVPEGSGPPPPQSSPR